jgi:acetylornithine deacetylase
MMSKEKAKIQNEISQKIDRMADEVFETIRKLVRIPSVVGQEGEAQEWMTNLYASLGLTVSRLIPQKEELIRHPAYSETGQPYNESRPNVIGILPGSECGRSIIINGDIDVVSPEPIETWDWG